MKKTALLLTVILAFSAATLYAQSAQSRLDNGKKLADQEDYDGAIREFNEAIRLDPKLAEAYAYRAWAYAGDNNNQAISDANKAIQLNPRIALAYFARAYSYDDKKDYDRAIADYTEAIRLDPKYTKAYNNRGYAYGIKKDYDRAIADYTEVIRLDPKYALAYNNRGLAYGIKKDYDRAIADYTEYIRLEPKDVDAYYNRGLAYHRKNDYDRAIADYEAALRIDPNHSFAKNNLEIARREAKANKNQRATEEANRYDPSKFTVVPSDFKPSDYTKVDLFKAASDARNLQITTNKYEAMYGQLQSAFMMGLGGSYYLQYVSDVTFVRQDGIDITFTSDDKAITQKMNIDQRSGLQAGQKVRVYYIVTKSPLLTWDVVAIEKR